MNMRWFLALSALAFLVATTGSDVFARVTVGGETPTKAVSEHFYWAGVQWVGTLMLIAPFGFVALIASWVQDRANTRMAVALFAVPTLYLNYSYFEGYHAAQVALLDKLWTAAILNIGLLPFFAIPVVLVTWLVGFILVRLKTKNSS